MSNFATPEDYRPLDEVVTHVDAKITVGKDHTKAYVGLENIPSRAAKLLGWGLADSSISTNAVFSEGDVLFGKLRPNLRKCVAAPFDGYCSTDVLVLRARDGIAPGFAVRVLQAESVGAAAERTAIGTKMPRTSWGNIKDVVVFCPNITEQNKIAQVLDTLDAAIKGTEAIVDKLKQVRQGLLHDLLTRGVDANGELRPSYEQAPDLYQDSSLGWVPKDWDVIPLLDAATNITDGTHQSVATVSSALGDVPFLFVSCVRDGEVAWDKSAFITQRDYQCISKGREPAPGIVLYTAVGSYGHAAEVRELRDFAFQRHIACIYPRSGKVVPGFMPLVLNWEPVRRYADRVALGNAQKTVTLGDLSAYPFICPQPSEQMEIVDRMAAAHRKLSDEVLTRNKLKLQKAGLMDDLLTGRVRVTPLFS